MSMVKVQTAELIGPALDWSVAKAEGLAVSVASCTPPGEKARYYAYVKCPYKPSRDWSQGGPLIDKYITELNTVYSFRLDSEVSAAITDSGDCGLGDNYLIAACRAIVATKLGDSVEVPQELLK